MTATSEPGGLEALYPFLYATSADPDDVLSQLRRSTQEKIAETVALRQSLAALHGQRLITCARAMAKTFDRGGRLFAFGNGGSSTDAQDLAQTFANPPPLAHPAAHPPVPGHPSAQPPTPTHLVGEPSVPTRPIGQPPVPTYLVGEAPVARAVGAIALAQDVAVLTALSNDVGFDLVFARQVAALGRASDVAVGLSTSGGSVNVLNAMDEARRRGMVTVGLVGYDGGKMAQDGRVEHLFVVPSASVHRIQEAQITLYHVLWELTQRALSGRL
ncbi:phosphoheptose isomerase [Acrocarpospora corrugata]|uniref:Phosphoheptose isomerase n=1 Tax=Acrocarpospora corrugata TaxID=35763 RepID=A0A5M3W1U1_9ACTN|nr:SIS domain-containing protein [Acrocarpospora corrugata]GES01283.1 phosphoheptose isomerase [Acrocarpospora corrugata]